METVDIQDATYMDIPVMEDTDFPRKEAVVQFLLYRVGNIKIEKKYKVKSHWKDDKKLMDFLDSLWYYANFA